MTKSNLLDKIDHDLASASRNLEVAIGLLAGAAPDISLANELLQASVEQMEDFRKFYQKLDFEDLENKQSMAAQK
jgi:hypothetical protein